jgi:hypothetical protein
MKLNSPLFDRIRVKPTEDRRPRKADEPCCEWKGCGNTATHRAPKGRSRENEYWRFCLDHVREYNHNYNFFAGMSDDAVTKYQKDSITGHRPTWKMGTGNRPAGANNADHAKDPFGMFREVGGGSGPNWRPRPEQRAEPERTVRNVERKALHELGLEVGAGKEEIKARFKLLVKRHHPDANGGDRASEDKLREIIQAYNYLKSSGAC